ncbi:DUF4224 domain-containing protein [Caballeronia sp. LjRoot34]|uniref:DUF4224 domain-containing protein n=1 Tax=Caballeronia sp. LjRoot34 TaxID=3342325 RepID=UPI003ECCF2A7
MAVDPRLMSAADLIAVTDKKRYTAQLAWFKRTFGVEPARSDKGRPVITWATFEALQAKRMGVAPVGGLADEGKVDLCFD